MAWWLVHVRDPVTSTRYDMSPAVAMVCLPDMNGVRVPRDTAGTRTLRNLLDDPAGPQLEGDGRLSDLDGHADPAALAASRMSWASRFGLSDGKRPGEALAFDVECHGGDVGDPRLSALARPFRLDTRMVG